MSETLNLLALGHSEGLSRSSPTPLYHQLFQLIRSNILDGTLQYGDRVPGEEELAKSLDVSRITAKRAMDELALANLVERHRGKGTHVIYRYEPKPVSAPLIGMLQEIEGMARNTDAKVMQCKSEKPPESVARLLNLQRGEKALHLIRVRIRDSETFGFYRSWTAGVRTPRASVFRRTPRLEYFRQQGLIISHVSQTLSAVGADRPAAAALDVAAGTPLLSLIRRSYTGSGTEEKLVDYLEASYNPELFQYQMDLTLE